METLLQSPSFLYRTELGSSGAPSRVTQLTPYEIASELSHFTTGAPPDAQLMAAADANLYSADPELLRYPQYTGMLPKLSG